MGRMTKQATLHRMVMPGHTCPYGLKSKHLLESRGFTVDDRWLTTREETDAFKAEHGVKTTPQTFIDGERVGGYEALLPMKRYFFTPALYAASMSRAFMTTFAVTWTSGVDVITAAPEALAAHMNT